jgi:hypothetical protein
MSSALIWELLSKTNFVFGNQSNFPSFFNVISIVVFSVPFEMNEFKSFTFRHKYEYFLLILLIFGSLYFISLSFMSKVYLKL